LKCEINVLILWSWLLTHNVREVLLVDVLGKVTGWVLLIELLLSLLVLIIETLNVLGLGLLIRLLLQLLLCSGVLLL
jgi:hypothetical protein